MRSQDYERLSKIFKNWYSHNLENKEHSLRGWNWGKAEFGKAELTFNVQNRPSFEVPYSEISNTNLAGRNEIAVEFGVDGEKEKKPTASKDQLTEIRFYIPGTTTRKEAEGEDAGSDADEEEKNAVTLFYDTLIEKADIGETAGDTIATFLDVLHLTPRFVHPSAPPPHGLPLASGVIVANTGNQRSFRYRHVRFIISVARQDVRLQAAVRLHQKVYGASKA